MSGDLLVELSVVEAVTLADLVAHFTELLEGTIDDEGLDDPAIARLVPDAYRDDPDAAAEFRRLTQHDLLDRRRDDAARVATALGRQGRQDGVDETEDPDASGTGTDRTVQIRLDAASVAAWLRTLTAIRLVLATRLGISDDTAETSHPRFGVYNWLGYRLDALVLALDG